jgi:hypothetical protein
MNTTKKLIMMIVCGLSFNPLLMMANNSGPSSGPSIKTIAAAAAIVKEKSSGGSSSGGSSSGGSSDNSIQSTVLTAQTTQPTSGVYIQVNTWTGATPDIGNMTQENYINPTIWTLTDSSGNTYTMSVPGLYEYYFPITLPSGATITEISVMFDTTSTADTYGGEAEYVAPGSGTSQATPISTTPLTWTGLTFSAPLALDIDLYGYTAGKTTDAANSDTYYSSSESCLALTIHN